MSEHRHAQYVDGCYRCELSRAEASQPFEPDNPDPTANARISETRGREVGRLCGPSAVVWIGHGLQLIDTYIDAEYRGEVVPHRHLSVAVAGHARRATDLEMARVRIDFGLEDAEEDNHQPGVARNLFRPLHLPGGTVGICDCKSDETVVIEPDGFRWSRALEEEG